MLMTSAAFAKNSRQADLLVARGATLARLGRRPEAIELVDQALELRLNNPTAHQLLSTLLAEQNDPRPRYRVTIITPTVAATDTDFLSIDGITDTDFFSITLDQEGEFDVILGSPPCGS